MVKANYLAAVVGNTWGQNYVLDHGQQPCTVKGTCPCGESIQVVETQLSHGISNIPKFSDIVI